MRANEEFRREQVCPILFTRQRVDVNTLKCATFIIKRVWYWSAVY